MKQARIDHYKRLGWTFEHREEVDHHNGDLDDCYYAKSPRLDEPFDLYSTSFEKAPEKWFLDREKRAYVAQRLGSREDWSPNQSAIEDAVEAALLKDPEAKRITVTIKLS